MHRRNETEKSETVSLIEAARRFGIGQSMAYVIAQRGGELTAGVKILRFGSAGRPVYRVSKAQIDAVLQAAPAAAAGSDEGPLG